MHLSYTFSDSYTSFRIKDSAKSGLRHGQSAILPRNWLLELLSTLFQSTAAASRRVEGVRCIEDQLPNLRYIILGRQSTYIYSHLPTAKHFSSIAFYCTLSCFQPSTGSYSHMCGEWKDYWVMETGRETFLLSPEQRGMYYIQTLDPSTR